MHDDTVLTLLHKQLTDQLESADRDLLVDWLANSSRNKEEQQEVSKIWELSGNYSPPFEPDVDKSFEKFSQRLKADVATQQPAKVLPMNPIRNWMKYAAAAVVLIGAIAVWQVSSMMNVDQLMVSTISDEVKSLDLADGTKVWVNEKSNFEYPSKFIKGERTVALDGEAFFDVAKNEKKPFIIKGGEADVRVLGTAFSFDTENEEGLMEVEVKEGTVEIKPIGSDESLVLTENERGYYDAKKKVFLDKELLAISNADFFVTSKYSFKNSKYTEVFSVLEDVYDVDFKFGNEGLRNCTFTSPIEFDRKNIQVAIDVIEAAYRNRNMTIEKTGEEEYTIFADPCD